MHAPSNQNEAGRYPGRERARPAEARAGAPRRPPRGCAGAQASGEAARSSHPGRMQSLETSWLWSNWGAGLPSGPLISRSQEPGRVHFPCASRSIDAFPGEKILRCTSMENKNFFKRVLLLLTKIIWVLRNNLKGITRNPSPAHFFFSFHVCMFPDDTSS